jgi:ABC-type phosphate transport system permease subunit
VEPGTVTDATAYADGVAALLVILVLVFNIAARFMARRTVRRLQGA